MPYKDPKDKTAWRVRNRVKIYAQNKTYPTSEEARIKKNMHHNIRIKATRKWYLDYKATLKCSNCPENHSSCLEFHHISKDKEFSLSRSSCMSIKRIIAEIAKCIVLCANCHRKEHDKLKNLS